MDIPYRYDITQHNHPFVGKKNILLVSFSLKWGKYHYTTSEKNSTYQLTLSYKQIYLFVL